MPDPQPPKLENFIPRDPLEHLLILRRNFAKIDGYVKKSPAGTVPNYLYNVLSQQFEGLSEKLLLPPTEGGRLTPLVLWARVHAEAQLDLVQEEEVEGGNEELADAGGRVEVVQDEELFRADNESSRDRDNRVGGPSPLHKDAVPVSSPGSTPGQPHEEGVGVPNPNLTPIQPREEVMVVANSDLIPSPPREDRQSPTRSLVQPQKNAVDVGESHASRGRLQELEVSSIPLSIELENDGDREIHVAIPALTAPVTSTNRSTPETPLEAYGVEMQNVHPTFMHIGTKAEKLTARKRLIADNRVSILSIHDIRDIKYIEWVSNDAPEKQQGSVLLEFRTPKQANEVIKKRLEWRGVLHNCQKYPRNCKPRQCIRCQVYGHGEKQCASLPRCQTCSGQHSTSRCSSRTLMCALCGGGHRADSRFCSKLNAEMDRVRHAVRDKSPFWPVNGTVKKTSGAAQKAIKSAFPQPSPAHRLVFTSIQNTDLLNLSDKGSLSLSKATAPAVWQPQDSNKSEKLALCRLDSASPEPPSARESTAKKVLKAVCGNRPKADRNARRKRKRASPSTGQQDKEEDKATRNPSSPPQKPKTALTIDSWPEFATDDDKEYW